jgi:uncharacterized protein (DUF305 family)
VRRVVVLVLLVAALSACGQQAPAPVRDPAPQPGPQAVASKGGFDATARAFIELVVATDDQVVKLLDAGAAQAREPALREFAAGLAGQRRAEAAELRAILGEERIPYVDNHAGHDMPGMPTEAELVALAAADDFDAEFTRLVRAHLTESATVARSGAGSITDPGTKAAADAMVQERAAALKSLDALG